MSEAPAEKKRPPIPFQDLSEDHLLQTVPRMQWHGRQLPALGTVLLTAKLGQGGMGAVYRAFHLQLRRQVAVKILPLQLSLDDELEKRFLREAQVAASITSPHLVPTLEVDDLNGLFYMIMELVDGVSAHVYLKTRGGEDCEGLPELDALAIVQAATIGLAAAHQGGIIHRDVKPANILLPRGPDGLDLRGARLADLGIARHEAGGGTLTASEIALGTPGYMAPEQGRDAKRVDKSADIFSMGATFYALLHGHPPFRGDSMVSVIVDTINKPHVPIRSLRPDVALETAILIERCLDKDPLKRPRNAAELRASLERLEDSLTREPVPASISTQKKPSKSRSQAPAPAHNDGFYADVLTTLDNFAAGRDWKIRLPLFLALAWFAVRQVDPAYSGALHRLDGALHWIGHAVLSVGGVSPMIFGGVAFPLLVYVAVIYRLLDRTAFFATAMTVGLVASHLHRQSRYIADAARRKIPLMDLEGFSSIHDWDHLLGAVHAKGVAAGLGLVVFGLAQAAMLAALSAGGYTLIRMHRGR